MKKLLVVIAVLAITMISSMAFAASEVTVSGSIDLRSRAFSELDHDTDVVGPTSSDTLRDTQERIRINVDAKAGDAKARITLENNWDTWGRVEIPQGNGIPGATGGPAGGANATTDQGPGHNPNGDPVRLEIREAWIDTPIAGPVHLKGGHQFLALGNAWFLRNAKYGDDAWLLYAGLDALTIGAADAKIAEGAHNSDADFYAALAVLKLGDLGTLGADFSHVVLSKKINFIAPVTGLPTYGGENNLDNLGLNANLTLGPLKLQGQFDAQMGGNKGAADPITLLNAESKYKGMELVIQGTLGLGPMILNFTGAQGTGNDLTQTGPTAYATALDTKQFVNVLDADQRYTLLYEYKFGQPGVGGVGSHNGFANTTALSVGADLTLGSLTLGANYWYLQATQNVAIFNGTPFVMLTKGLGQEVDARINWKISDNVSWNWTLGYFVPGDAYKQTDPLTGLPKDGDVSTGVQGILSMKF
jgi:hypothetical protein